MAHYWKKCPYCGKTLEEGIGASLVRFGKPEQTCRYCSKTYKDRSFIDWPTATFLEKLGFCFANGRFFVCIMAGALLSVSFGRDGFIGAVLGFSICSILCWIYVTLKVYGHYGDCANYKTQKAKIGKNHNSVVVQDMDFGEELEQIKITYPDYSQEFLVWIIRLAKNWSSSKMYTKKYMVEQYLSELKLCKTQKTGESALQLCYQIYSNKMDFDQETKAILFRRLDDIMECDSEVEKIEKRKWVIDALVIFILVQHSSVDHS